MNSEIEKIKKEIDLQDYALRYYNIESNHQGKAHCPFHPPDNNPSFQFWIGDDGVHRFTDYHDNEKGTIIDFEVKMNGLDVKEAIQSIKEKEGLIDNDKRQAGSSIHYIYRDIANQIVYRKVKKVNLAGEKQFWFENEKNGSWINGKGNHELIPYNLPESEKFDKAIICEGEKDADNVNSIVRELELNYWVTSASNGKASWPPNITKYFKSMNEIIFIYDVGAEKDAKNHALKLISAFPEITVYIAKIPLDKEGADITDYCDQSPDRSIAFLDIQKKAKRFYHTNEGDELAVETSEELLNKDIPKVERLINPYIERNGFTIVGGSKGVGKSLFVTQMALHFASGKSDFLNSTIEKPGKVLLIQQEVSEAGMQDRIKKMVSELDFNTQHRFFTKTTTGNQWDLTDGKDKGKIISLIEKINTDVLILDPLYTFFPGELNQAKDMSRIISVLMELKTKYNLSLIVVHHFSNKKNPDDPRPSTGRFMGHSNLANAADVTIAIDFLHPNYKERSLSLPYNHYAVVETTTRHAEWPGMLHIERGENQLLFRISSIWDEIGKKVPPDEIVEFIKECGGEKPQADVISHFEKTNNAHANTIRKSINEVVGRKLEKNTVPGQHGKKILKVIDNDKGPGG